MSHTTATRAQALVEYVTTGRILDFTGVDGERMRLDQVALQTWRDGYIVNERFLYDTTSATTA